MSVIINELEVAMPASAPAEAPPGGEAPVAPPAAGPRPLDLRGILRHLEERRDRLAAS